MALKVGRGISSEGVIASLSDLFAMRGVPRHIRCDNGPEFVAKKVRTWLTRLDVGPLYIEPGSPWEKGYASHCTSFVGFGATSGKRLRIESFRPCCLTGGWSPGCSYKHSFLSL